MPTSKAKLSQSRLRRLYKFLKAHEKVNFFSTSEKFVHLLSKREICGVDALMGHTRSHPEHDG